MRDSRTRLATLDFPPAPGPGGTTLRLLGRDELPRMQRLIDELNPSISPDVLRTRVAALPAYDDYRAVGAFAPATDTDPADGDDGLRLVAVCGLWDTLRPYCGRMLETDHVVVDAALRSVGVGAALMGYVEAIARAEAFDTIELNAYHRNTRGHAFYAREGYTSIGHHFQKVL